MPQRRVSTFFPCRLRRHSSRDKKVLPLLSEALRVRLAPIGLDVLDDLIASNDLDPAYKAKMPVFTLASTNLTWTAKDATINYLEGGIPVACVSGGLATGANAGVPAPAHSKCSP